MSSGMIPLEDFEYAIAHLSMLPDRVEHVKKEGRQPLEEVGQRQSSVLCKEGKKWRESLDAKGRSEKARNGPTLPLEIVSMIGMILFNESHLPRPTWLIALQSPTYEEGSHQASAHHSFKALLHLSSVCKSFRSVLASLVWHSVHFHHPRHFGEFVHLMKRYKSISSPLTAIAGASPTSEVSHEWTQEYPLRLVKEMYLVMPQRYPGFDQSLLVGLLRDGMRSSLQHVIWEAEELPAASTLKAMAGEDFYSPSRYVNGQDERETPSFGLASEIGEEDIVRWTRSSRDGEAFPCRGQLLPPNTTSNGRKMTLKEETFEEGLNSLSVNCKCFWPGHAVLSKFQNLRHLHLTYYDLFLLPPHLPALLEHLRQPLLSLSMSTSKTSLLHSIPLINLGCFDHLQILDTYPVTPEYPLPQAIRRCRKTLRVLRLVMDISAHFTNFDNLWKILSGQDEPCSDEELQGSMEALEILHIDPMPQQNTAPSFASFVEACPRLQWVNGRRRDSFAPGMEPIDPDHITSALYY